jgi:hypothetical protein
MCWHCRGQVERKFIQIQRSSVRVMKMRTHVVLVNREQEIVEREHLEALDETCRILQGLKLCSRHCATCPIASNIAEIALPPEKKAEIWDPSLALIRRR